MKADQRIWGYTAQGEAVWLYKIEAPCGAYIELSSLGATWVCCVMPDQNGFLADVLLGYSSLDGYLQDNNYIGVTVGRFANRIANGSFSISNQTCQLDLNDGLHSNHSGGAGLHKKIWKGEIRNNRVIFSLQDPDRAGGFPGNIALEVIYTLTENLTVSIDFKGISDRDTILNLTNHAYFNLRTEGSVVDHSLQLFSDTILSTTSDFIPTGDLLFVKGTEFDFLSFKRVGEDIDSDTDQLRWNRGYNHCYLLPLTETPILQQAASLQDPVSGRRMDLYTTYPSVLFYSAGYLTSSSIGKKGVSYQPMDGLCLEAQYYPDAPNHLHFPSCLLKKGERYIHRTEYRFTTYSIN